MPVEPVGLVFAVAGLFTTCLDLLDIISSAKVYSAAYVNFVCVLEVEKVLFVKWGEAAGLPSNPGLSSNSAATRQLYSKQLEDEDTLSAVAEILGCLKRRFEDANALVTKYTPRHRPTDEVLFAYSDNNPHLTIRAVHARQGRMLKRVQSETSLAMKTRWAISGRARSLELISEISKLSGYLRLLVPIPKVEVDHFGGSVSGVPILGSISVVDTQPLGIIKHNGLEHITSHQASMVEGELASAGSSYSLDPSGPRQTLRISAVLEMRSKQRRKWGWMGNLIFILLVYMIISFSIIISFVIAVMKVLLPYIFSFFGYIYSTARDRSS